ncbi:MAG TPA: hypothetical protein VHZ03_51920 [Trebonia sp.]|jgi:hypothetical protein|nr:hypothetical protein [Trebonia sp.]
MRFHPATGLAIAGAMVAALTATACSSSSTSSSTTPPTATSAATSAASASASASATVSGTGTSSSAAAQITTNWEAFFNSSTSTAKRLSLLQNGSALSSAIASFSSNPLAADISAKVLSVTLTSPTQATVKYDLDGPGGTALLSNQTGTAVLVNGVWQVGDASFCGLLTLAGGTLPSACKS